MDTKAETVVKSGAGFLPRLLASEQVADARGTNTPTRNHLRLVEAQLETDLRHVRSLLHDTSANLHPDAA